MSWSPERIERLKGLWTNNAVSAAKIAETLNREFPGEDFLTRNAVIGKSMRLQLPLRSRQQPLTISGRRVANGTPFVFGRRQKPLPKDSAVDLPAFPFAKVQPVRQPKLVEANDASMADLAVARARGCTLLDLTADTCRWPMGDPRQPGFFFCGEGPAIGRPYCPFHWQMSRAARAA